MADTCDQTLLLFFELPDANQELFAQLLPRTFPLFPKLPVEIRLKIWGLATPKAQNIELAVQYKRFPVRNTGAVPITLKVNKESRDETQKNHYVFFQQDAFRPKNAFHRIERHPKPLCIAPTKDNITVQYSDLFSPDLRILLEHINQQKPKCLKLVTHLTVADLYWNGGIEGNVGGDDSKLKPLVCFKALKIIRFVHHADEQMKERQLEAVKNEVVRCFQLIRGTEAECSIPEVIIEEIQ